MWGGHSCPPLLTLLLYGTTLLHAALPRYAYCVTTRLMVAVPVTGFAPPVVAFTVMV